MHEYSDELNVQLVDGCVGQVCKVCGYQARGKRHRNMLSAVCSLGQETLAKVGCCDLCIEAALERARELGEEKLLKF